MSNVVQLKQQVETTPSDTDSSPDLDENVKIIVRHLARQAAKEYFESYQQDESKREPVATLDVDSTDSEGV